MPQHPALSKDRVAVITGGASGIGLAAAKRFGSIGMKLVLADLSQDRTCCSGAWISQAPRRIQTPLLHSPAT
jgi:NAD(P)-dependent dehydrogenase (short-subunit alcohol dehydrogenase family)